MTDPKARSPSDAEFVSALFSHLLKRNPRLEERDAWVQVVQTCMSDREVMFKFTKSAEFRKLNEIVPGHIPGHFYSPIVKTDEIGEYFARSSNISASEIEGIGINLAEMKSIWAHSLDFLKTLRFSSKTQEMTRYYTGDQRYPFGDVLVLAAMMFKHRPKRIIEIGSGFSTAAMLDILDAMDDKECVITCIDPYPARLKSLLRDEDQARVTILGTAVQNVELSLFDSLEKDDFIFIDSSHVLKTGSDVHHELFNILPRAAKGVIVHFHDIQFPFEYPSEWVFNKRWSWNEIYAVRAFLMYNSNFCVRFFSDLFFRELFDDIATFNLAGAKPIAGSLWVERIC